ncbi:hypothetical protein [Caballeronia sp. J97]|uniref:hypothetical protein n=1 Tax=Caballeronia sp. J97 TaxID=2805429 RepID=UPI002AAFEC90|nr:hypothetical protein [Caballeronia sp. J97]
MFLNKNVYQVELKINSLYREAVSIDRSYIFDNKLYLFGNETDGYSYQSVCLDASGPKKLHRQFRVVEASPGRKAGGRIDARRKFQAMALLRDGASVAAVSRGVNLSEATAYRYWKELQGVVALRPQNVNSLLRILAFPGGAER